MFNNELMRLARQARNMSQSELSLKANVSQAMISKIENDTIKPTEEIVHKIALATQFPVAYFYENDRVYGLPASIQYRKKASVGKKAMEQIEAQVNLRVFHSKRLMKSIELDEDLPLPVFDVDEYNGDIEKIADLVRRTWLIPRGPLKNLIDYVERAGCLVFLCDFEELGIDGITLKTHGFMPCIFLNKHSPADRQRFTLAHELGHLVMHKTPSQTMEEEADLFASHLLIPSQDIRGYFIGRVTIVKLAALKPIWKVSMGSLLFAADRVGAITPMQKRYLWTEMSKLGYRTHEPPELDFAPEIPVTLNEAFRLHVEDLDYGIEELSIALRASVNDLISMYPLPKKKKAALKLIK